jgi:hypothetical protein
MPELNHHAPHRRKQERVPMQEREREREEPPGAASPMRSGLELGSAPRRGCGAARKLDPPMQAAEGGVTLAAIFPVAHVDRADGLAKAALEVRIRSDKPPAGIRWEPA